MAKKSTPQPPGPELRAPHADVAATLDERMSKGSALLQREVTRVDEIKTLDGDYDKWSAYNEDLLRAYLPRTS